MALSQQQTAQIQAQYDPLRKKAQQQETANLQGAKDALARRAAQLGGGPSGALIKQESIAQDAMARRLADANEGINAQQQGAIQQAQEIQAQRDFQKAEREAGQAFQQGQFDKQFGFQKEQAANQNKQWQSTFDFTKGQTKIENDINIKNNILTQLQNLKNAGYNPDQISTIMQSLGLGNLGLDIDLSGIPGVTQRPPMVSPKSGGFGAQAQAVEENKRNGYTVEEMKRAGIIGDSWS